MKIIFLLFLKFYFFISTLKQSKITKKNNMKQEKNYFTKTLST
jgi:hypothetical protein